MEWPMFGLWGGDKETKFWKWFVHNEARLFVELDPNNPKLDSAIEELHSRLRKVQKHLVCEVMLAEPKKILALSPKGIRAGIPLVESLHAKAPSLPRWEIVKFKQRKPHNEDFKIRFADRELTSDAVRYRFTAQKDRVGIELLFAGYEEQFLDVYQNVGFIMLDSMLGEYDVMTKVGAIDFLPLPEGSDHYPPISNLAMDFDEQYNKLI
jgi:hypothetical protein